MGGRGGVVEGPFRENADDGLAQELTTLGSTDRRLPIGLPIG